MKTLQKRWTAIIFHLIPQVIAAFSYYSFFDILSVYLNDEQKDLWFKFGITWAILFVISLGLTVYHQISKKKLGLFYAIPIFLLYAIFLQFYGNYMNDLFPFGIPRWVLDETTTSFMFYVLTLIGIFHSILIMVVNLTKENISKTKIWLNLLYSALFPLFWYIFIHILARFFNIPTFNNFIAFAFILSIAAFLFFIFRFIYGITQKKNYWHNNRNWLIILFALIFPIAGLYLNNYGIDHRPENIFGDFSHPIFYIICLVNTIALLISKEALKNKWLHLLLYTLKAVGFAYVLYFFLIFLPFLPLSILAVIAFGLGFLMLSPIFLFVIQLKCLSDDFISLKTKFKKSFVITFGVLGFCLLPFFVIVKMYAEKNVLHKAMNGVTSYSLTQNQEMPNTVYLKNVLSNIENSKKRNNINNQGVQPIITPLYKTLVLDNLTLSQHKLTQIKEVYFPEDTSVYKKPVFFQNATERVTSSNQLLGDIKTNVSSVWKGDFYESSIDFWVTNNSSSNNQEFATTLNLPIDAFVTDYYLMINGEKVNGILAERKSAEWIYNEITNTNRDPGFLRYIEPNKILLQIFPFRANETRKSGFKIIHKEPFELKFCNKTINLGDRKHPVVKPIKIAENNFYISAEYKKELPDVKLTPTFYYLIYNGSTKDYKHTINREIVANRKKYPKARHLAVLTDFNSRIYDLNKGEDWIKSNVVTQGGFFVEKAIKKIVNTTKSSINTYPVFTLFDAEYKAIFPAGDLKQYNTYLWGQEIMKSTDLKEGKFEPITAKLFENKHLKVAVPNDSSASFIVNANSENLDIDKFKSKDWYAGMNMKLLDQQSLFDLSNIDDNWLNSLKMSFKTQLLNNNTAFIALENEAQKKLLLKKQEDILNGKYGLDTGEERRMSEPYFYFLLLVFIFFFGIKYKP